MTPGRIIDVDGARQTLARIAKDNPAAFSRALARFRAMTPEQRHALAAEAATPGAIIQTGQGA